MKLYEMIFEMPMFKSFSEREKKKFAKIEHPFLEFTLQLHKKWKLLVENTCGAP
ncbi:hypothetical protein H8E77_39315 [bacterium]|nr:hypothetical protein [bacterium]